jgi:hypothetical protein
VPSDDMTSSLWKDWKYHRPRRKPVKACRGWQATAPRRALNWLTGSADYQYCDIGATDASEHPHRR